MAVPPEVLREFERLTLEVADDERKLAKKQARLIVLRQQMLSDPTPAPEPEEEPKRATAWEHIRGDVLGVLNDEARMTKAIAKVIKAIHDLGGEATTAQLAAHLGITDGAMSVRLSRAVEHGLLRRKKPGVYVLPARGTPEESGA